MKATLLKQRKRICYLYIGLWVLAVNFLLASTSLVQAADTRIAFMSNRTGWGNGEIYLMNPDGKQIRQLTEQAGFDEEPAWSPDGKKITFVSYRDLKPIPKDGIWRGEIYLMNADGSNPTNLTRLVERADGVSSWSPNGQQIAFTSAELFNEDVLANSDIFVMDADGANPINITNHDALDQTPDWSPDGMRITFASNRDRNWEIYLMNPDGANPINITNHPARDGRPDWSPDGKQIAFSSDREGNLEIYVMSANGANPINITNHPAEDDNPSWSPDGTRIAFSSYRDGNLEIYVMNNNGVNPINITNHPDWDRGPSWSPAPTLSVPSNERLATLWGKVKRINTYGVK